MSVNSDMLSVLQELGNFSQEELGKVMGSTQKIILKKGEKLLTRGQTCRELSFLESGAMVHQRPLENGSFQILNLGLPGDWILDHASFTQQKPSQYELVAFTNSKLRGINIDQLHTLISQSPSFFQLGKILDASNPFSHHTLVNLSPSERYQLVLDQKPQLLQAFPLKLIAALLEITPETLSRVRKKASL